MRFTRTVRDCRAARGKLASWSFSLVGLLVLQACCGCGDRKTPEVEKQQASGERGTSPFQVDVEAIRASQELPPTSIVKFEQVEEQLGIEHVYQNGAAGKVMLVETTGGGCGWLDYDRDGWPDLYANQGGDPAATSLVGQPTDQLFRSLGGQAFHKVTSESRVEELRYSQGVAVGDYDNDGFDDVYVTNLGRNTLWRNCGDGTFIDTTAQCDIGDTSWSCSAAWGDLDNDGDLDLYVCNYCHFDPLNPKTCLDSLGRPTICNPGELSPVADTCYFNDGQGGFVEQASQRGLVGAGNRALGVAIVDFDQDGWQDIYVANDTTENFLFVNDGEGHFTDQASVRGCAVNREGATQASMGLAIADVDRNGLLDIYSTHYFEESNTLYANFGDQGFQDITALAGLHRPTLASLGFGATIADFDSDAQWELLIANGHVDNSPQAPDPRMLPQLFTQSGKRWVPLDGSAGGYFNNPVMGRGVATADFDGDLDLDVAVVHQNDKLAILQNRSHSGSQLVVELIGRESNRSAIGAQVQLFAKNLRLTAQLCGGTSYAVSHQSILHFGLGDFRGTVTCRVRWPSGNQQNLTTEVDRRIRVVESRASR